jgi:glycosyltransferase involved in cell wall biosynthesis
MTEIAENPPEPKIPDNYSDIGKVVVLSGSFPPMPCGVGDSVWELARELFAMGIDIEAVTDTHALPCNYDDDDFGQSSCPFPIHNVIPNWGLSGIKKIVRSIEKLEPKILHIHYPTKAYGSGLAVPFLTMLLHARRRKIKIVITLHEFKLSHHLRRQASFMVSESADAIVMPCPLEIEALIERHKSVEEKNHYAIPVGPVGPSPDPIPDEMKRQLRHTVRDSWKVSDDDVVLLHYGTPTKSKGLEILFKALKWLKDEGETPRLMIAGDFRPKEDEFHELLEKQTVGLGIKNQVTWLGRRRIEELPGIFLASDIGVFPFLDGWSFRRSSMTSVLAWDIPIITTYPDGEIPEIEDQDKVRFVEPNDPKALATALLSLLANPKALEVFKGAKNPLMEHFKWKNIAAKYVTVYRDVLKS